MSLHSLTELGDALCKTEIDQARRLLVLRYPKLDTEARDEVAREAVAMMHRHSKSEVTGGLIDKALGVWLRHKVLPYDDMCSKAARVLGTDRLPDNLHRSMQGHFMAIVAQMERHLQGRHLAA
jgi:hypothetical protein